MRGVATSGGALRGVVTSKARLTVGIGRPAVFYMVCVTLKGVAITDI